MSESTEMYLETILVIQKKKGHVRSIDIAREMNFSKPTISQQMKRLKEKELGSLTVDFNLSLTKSLKTLIISMLLSFFIVKFVKL